MVINKQGGPDRGQGRKKIRHAMQTFRADEDVFNILSKQDNKTEYINKSIRCYNKDKNQ